MYLLEFIPPKKSYLFTLNFFLGLSLAFSFEPFNVPFLSLIVIGIYFLINDYSFKKLKIFFSKFIRSSLSNAFPSDNIGTLCLTFLNDLEGLKPTEFLGELV